MNAATCTPHELQRSSVSLHKYAVTSTSTSSRSVPQPRLESQQLDLLYLRLTALNHLYDSVAAAKSLGERQGVVSVVEHRLFYVPAGTTSSHQITVELNKDRESSLAKK